MGISNFKWATMLLAEGAIEILEELGNGNPGQFKDFARLINPRTENKFSPNTVSRRLKELVSIGAVKETIVKSKEGKNVIGYVITNKGLEALDISRKYEKSLEGIFKEK